MTVQYILDGEAVWRGQESRRCQVESGGCNGSLKQAGAQRNPGFQAPYELEQQL